MTHLINLKKISRTYQKGTKAETKALIDFDLTVDEGEFIAILGKSGSGKSTLMHVIGLLDGNFEGGYDLKGEDTRKLSKNKLAELRSNTVGFVFQQFNLLKKYTVMENILLPTTYYKIPDKVDKAFQILEDVDLADKANAKANELSGGQMQRVAIARALMMNPDIILADEPTGNLDSKTAKAVMKVLKDLNKQGKTVIIITHEKEIAAYADRQIILSDGKLSKDTK